MTPDPSRRELELYEVVRELEPDARAVHLEKECAGEPDLRGRVESLLSAVAPSASLASSTAERDPLGIEKRAFDRKPGSRIGDFCIQKRLGAGGMGEVYLASDTRLHRTVAIKLVSAKLEEKDSWRKRLLTEAQAISALNHPNICTLYDIGQQDGNDYLVMEYLDGETLADRLERKALSFDEALDIADQIATALRVAHSRGILHRDLKPGNIMLTKAGVKVLDFGLAKFVASRKTDGHHAGTLDEHAETNPGMILGTASYMSPEQARGDTVDQQTDIWSFGCVLYEMLSRRQAFGGRTESDSIAACLEREPDWSALPSSTPRSLRILLSRCLCKDRESRLHDISDARIELRDAREGGPAIGTLAEGDRPASVTRERLAALLVFTALAAAALAAFGVWSFKPSLRTSAVEARRELSITLPHSAPLVLERSLLLSIGRPSIVLSPDGSRVVYVASHEDSSILYVRGLDTFEAKPISGTEGGFSPFFSPDGEWVGFFAKERLHKVSLRGGRPMTLCEAPNPYGGTWGTGDTIVFAVDFGSHLRAVSANGGPAEQVTPRRGTLLEGTLANFHWPQFLPGSRAVVVSTGPRDNRLEVISIPGGEVLTRIEEPGNQPFYAHSGHLLFGRSGDLYAMPFDVRQFEVTGPAVPMISGVRTAELASGGAHQSTVASDGTVAYVAGPALDEGSLVWSDQEGNTSPAFAGQGVYGSFQISPDGKRLAVTVVDLSSQIWIYDFEGDRPPLRLTSEGQSWAPVWYDEGERVVFTSFRGGQPTLLSKRADGTGKTEELLPRDWKGGQLNKPRAVSPDGKVLLFDGGHAESGTDAWMLYLDTRQVEPFLQGPDGESATTFSPDGKSVAYTSDRTGGYDVFVCPFPAGKPSRQISTGGGEEPIWSPEGDVIFYRNGDRWMKATLDGGSPELLFRGPYLNASGISYDYDGDRRQFLLVRGIGTESAPCEIRVILNAFTELERLAPTKRR